MKRRRRRSPRIGCCGRCSERSPENLEAGRIDELYDQQQKAPLDQRFLADLKRWRLLLANGFALRNQSRPLADLTLASQQLLDRFLFCRMLETYRLVEHNKLARAFVHYEALYGEAEQEKTFAEVLKETLFAEIKRDFNTELFVQPLLCDELRMDNLFVATAIGHEPLHSEIAAQCGIEAGQRQLLPFKHLYGYDFSRMSQNVMGAVYERFLAHRLLQDGGRIVIEDTDELRKREGIYYTPQYIVDYIVAHTLGEKVKPTLAEALTLLGYGKYAAAHAKIRELQHLKVLDPAMGSGSFLLRAFDALVRAYGEYNEACRRAKADRRNGSGLLFDAPADIAEEVTDAPLHVLTENIFGVDLDAQAVEVAKLSLWLRYMALNRESFRDRLRSRSRRGKPLNLLPTLTRNLKRGNSLIDDPAVAGDAAFAWQKEFPEVMQAGGFDVVIGNPPYGALFEPHHSDYLVQKFRVFRDGVRDVYACFMQASFTLARKGGQIGFIVPSAWLGGPDYNPLRKELLKWRIEAVLDLPFDVFPDAYVDTVVVVFRREACAEEHLVKTYSYPKRLRLEAIQIAEESYGRVRQAEWAGATGQKFVLSSPALSLMGRLERGIQTRIGNFITMKRGVLFDPGLLTEEKSGPQSFPYFEGDVYRYTMNAVMNRWIVFDDRIRERPAEFDWFQGPRVLLRRLLNRRGRLMATLATETFITNKNLYSIRPESPQTDLAAVLGVLNSRLASYLYTHQVTQATIEDVCALPYPDLRKNKHGKEVAKLASSLLALSTKRTAAIGCLGRKIHHQNRTPCSLAHYLQKDFAAVLKHEILLDDVQRAGFVHAIMVESEGKQVTVSATIADDGQSSPRSVPIVLLEFKDVSLRQFQNTASAGFQPDTNLNTIRSLVPGKTVSVALSSSAIFAAN
jgi:type I restriction-modification system DNA methylase subunit